MEKVSKFTKLSLRVFKAVTVFSLAERSPKTETSLKNLPSISLVSKPLTVVTPKNRGRGLCLGEQGLPSKETRRKGSTYKVDFKVNERSCGQVVLDDVNIAVDMVSKGYAKVGHVQKANESIYKTQY